MALPNRYLFSAKSAPSYQLAAAKFIGGWTSAESAIQRTVSSSAVLRT